MLEDKALFREAPASGVGCLVLRQCLLFLVNDLMNNLNWGLLGEYSVMVHIRAFGAFREILGRERDVEVKEGSTIKDLLNTLTSSNERFRSALLDEAGNVRDYVTLTKNKKSIDFLEGLGTELNESDEVAMLPPIAGG